MQVYQPMPPGGKPTEFNKYHHHHHDHHHHWTLTASQRRRIEAAEMKLLRPLAGHSLHDHKTNEYTRRELRITGILDKIRWIQTELAFTLAKNATKPNPFEIIPLQTTRKENNWKTKEALAQAAVTQETEWIKGSNPWCLWWWYFINQWDVEKPTGYRRSQYANQIRI